jgi:hypothetical protein
LAKLRLSHSPFRFSEKIFNDFRKKANRAVDKTDVMAKAFPILKNDSDFPFGIKRTFANLIPLTDSIIVDA